jgi:hypothetical protein
MIVKALSTIIIVIFSKCVNSVNSGLSLFYRKYENFSKFVNKIS